MRRLKFDVGSLRRAAVVAGMLALFVFVVVPTQTYLSSPDLFDYSYAQLLAAGLFGAAGLAAVGFGVLWLVGFLSYKAGLTCFIRYAPVFGLALLVCLYLETGLLSIGLPSLNGLNAFPNTIRGIFDASVWLAVIAVFFIFRAFVLRAFKWIVCSLALLAVASLFDSSLALGDAATSPLAEGFRPCSDVLRSVRFSRTRNVMVYILDMTPASVTTDVVERNPSLKLKFPGFTAFRRNLAMHDVTMFGLPALMTGRYYGPGDTFESFRAEVFSTDSFLSPYVAASNAVYCSSGLHPYGYTNRSAPKPIPAPRHSTASTLLPLSLLRVPSSTLPNFRMCDAMAIRLVPYRLKRYFLDHAIRVAHVFRPSSPFSLAETVAYPILAASEPTDEPLVLSVVHTDALHCPLRVDRLGRPLPKPLSMMDGHLKTPAVAAYRAALHEVGFHVLTQLGALFDALRAKGVYDNTTIIVVADHGCITMAEGENHGEESSILWIKPESARDPFRYSDAPTTNARIRDLVLALREGPLPLADMTETLSASIRIFRADFHGQILHAFGGKLHYKDWVYDREARLVEIRQK